MIREYDDYMQFKVWMLGGQIDSSGNTSEGFNTFTEHLPEKKNEVRGVIKTIAIEFGSNADFRYYDENYNFDLVSVEDIDRLTNYVLENLYEVDP